MMNCEQTKGQSVYQHGLSVKEHFSKIVAGEWDEFKLPDWFKTNWPHIKENIYAEEIWAIYTVFHDCGKPYCRIVDSDGRTHFPNHAQVSKDTYLKYVGGDPVIAKLIELDMAIHTFSAEQIEILCLQEHVKTLNTLLVAAYAELHSNAKMFGGIESTSFKIKYKQLDRRGKQICANFAK